MKYLIILVVLGSVWGLQLTLTKIATNAGFRDFGIVFWIAVLDLLLVLPLIGRLPLHRRALYVYGFVGLIGTTLPPAASVTASQYLPAGAVAVGHSFAPLMTLPIAVMMGTDQLSSKRILGLLAGLAGVILIVVPGGDLASSDFSYLFLLALIAPLFYAIEGNVIARYGTAGLSPMQIVAGASAVGILLAGPAALWRGSFITPTQLISHEGTAVVGGAVMSVFAYIGYLWLIGRAGAVFAAQVAYLVTGFGVLWSMAFLGERFPPSFWIALAAVMLGVFLVQPRPPSLQATLESRKNAADGSTADSGDLPE